MLSNSIESIKDEYEVVVIGSGYGGGVSASRLARAGYEVCVLERGKEFTVGEFPDTLAEATSELQLHIGDTTIGSPTALFDVRVNKDMNVVMGCGLGGTSLINANVAMPADARVFEDVRWPQAFRDDKSHLNKGYELAKAMLRPNIIPAENKALYKKYQAHQQSAMFMRDEVDYSHCEFVDTPINVTFKADNEENINHVGVKQPACNHCGDCVTGCNVGAKNTTAMNYLPDAVNHGAQIFCEVSVRYISQDADGYLIHYQSADNLGQEKFLSGNKRNKIIRAKKVVLAAGTLGSTELLLRSKEQGLNCSDRIGDNFTGNGDVLAFGYNCDVEINGIGFGDADPENRAPVGPCITSVIDGRATELDQGFVLEEGSLPGAVAMSLTSFGIAATSAISGIDTDTGLKDKLQEKYRELTSMVGGSYRGAMRNTQTYLVMSHDGSDGKMVLADDHLRIDWPGMGDKPIFESVNKAIYKATEALGGTYLKNPITNEWLDNDMVTVHPLGGCAMADEAATGVVNHKGQVFSGNHGDEVHQGLYVTDGSVMPRSLGINPLLTITAVSERMCMLLAEDDGKTIDYSFGDTTKMVQSQKNAGIRFTERMAGYIDTHVQGDYASNYTSGKKSANENNFDFILTIVSQDVETMLSDKAHKANMFGTVNAPLLSDHPLTATQGVFQLFVEDENDADIRYMKYDMQLMSVEGKRFHFNGYKEIKDDFGFDMWADTTTLFVDIFDDAGAQIYKGKLTIAIKDFMKQLTTVKAINCDSSFEQAKVVASFSTYFAKNLNQVYGL
jgi:cholesterol oxidase